MGCLHFPRGGKNVIVQAVEPEAVKGIVLLRPGAEVSEAELIAHVKQKLGSVKAPESIDFITELPKSPVGKVLKTELR